MLRVMGREARKVVGRMASRSLREEATRMAMEMGRMGVEGNGNEQDGGGQAPLAYNNAAQFLAAWNTAPSDHAKDHLEQETITRSPAQDVQIAAMMKINLRLQATVGQLTKLRRLRWPRLTYLPGRPRPLPMVLQAWIVSDLRRPRSMGIRRRASMWVIESLSSRIIFEVLPTRIISGWHPPIWSLDPVCYDCAWLSLTALSTFTCNLWL
jgi:hypothetical protein